MATQRQLFVTVTRASLTLTAALALARVFPGASWFFPVAIAAILPPLIFEIIQHRRWNPWWGAVIVPLVGLWLTIVVDDPSETVAGIPSASAFSTFAHDFTQAPHILRSAVVPVRPVGGSALLLAVLAVFVTAAATDVVGRRLDAPMGAIGPSVALYIAIAALGSGRWAPTLACYGFGIVAYLVALQYAEMSARRTWFQSQRTRRSQTITGGLAAGALIIALAIVLGPEFPGARGGALINYRHLGQGKGSSLLSVTSPLVTIHSKLTETPNTEVFSVSTKNGVSYHWRIVALDDLNNNGTWGIKSVLPKSPSDLPKPTDAPGATQVSQNYQISSSVSSSPDALWLPAVYQANSIDEPGANVLTPSTSLLLTKHSPAGTTYNVESEVRTPSEAELRAVTMNDLDPMSAEAQPRKSFPKKVGDLADQLTKDVSSPFDKAARLEAYFQSDLFTYNQNVNYDGDPHALEHFVLTRREGFCEQFATAFAEMARSVGLPTRVAVGYQSQSGMGKDGRFHVKGADAHAWPEVWLGQDIGWFSFEPTKGRFDPNTGRGDTSVGQTTPSSVNTPTTVANGTTAPRTGTTVPNNANKVQIPPTPTTGTKQSSTAPRVLLGIAIAIGVALLIVIGTLIALTIAARRRTRRRRADADARRRVLGAWTEALERLAAAGVTARPSATSVEFALRHAPAHGAGGAGPPLMDLARLQTAAMFAPDPPSDAEAERAWKHVDEIDVALRQTVPRSERWITRLRIRKRDRQPRTRRAKQQSREEVGVG